MGEKLIIGPINKGLRTDRTAFVIDNDSFPTLTNAYQWRGRIKRKRGTTFLDRLERFFNSTGTQYFPAPGTIPLTAGSANLLTGFNLQASGNIDPGFVIINDITSVITYTDDGQGNLVGGTGGTINYATGEIHIDGGGSDVINAQFYYFPGLPVMGVEELILTPNDYPGCIAFDTEYAYRVSTAFPYPAMDITFYSNPVLGSYPSPYVPKDTPTPFTWNGLDYQQFGSINYLSAFWATNGVQVPFNISNIGMQFAPSNTIMYVSNTATSIDLIITDCPLVIGDFVFLNEFVGSTAVNS